MRSPKKIAIFGSTGSIGTQALDIIRENREDFTITLLTAHRQADVLIQQAKEFAPEVVVIANEAYYAQVKTALQRYPIEVLTGEKALETIAGEITADIVLMALVGYSGVYPTYRALQSGKTVALANKETMVVAGTFITREAQKQGVQILPVDSEHSAIYQCLMGEYSPVERILLTASGGPFRTLSLQELQHVTPKQALAHPNWSMGQKVTIDSASLMNKGFEMMEACWFFNLPPERIEVLVHPQSIVHSMVQFEDGSVKAQLGIPDMRLPIGFALGEEKRIANSYSRLDFTKLQLSFEHPDMLRFPNLALAYEAMRQGNVKPCALNAANEVAVAAFLHDEIPFTAIHAINQATMEQTAMLSEGNFSLESLVETNRDARALAQSLVRKYS